MATAVVPGFPLSTLRFPLFSKEACIMKCAKCGLDLPPGTKTCPRCGNVNEFAPVERRATNPLVYVISALAVIGVIALIFYAVFAAKGEKSVTTVPPGQPSEGTLTAVPPPQPGPTSMTPPAIRKPSPPAEVVDYLNFVKQVEEHRQMLLKDATKALTLAASSGGTKALLSMIDMAMDPEGTEAMDPLAETKQELNRQQQNWRNTLDYFDKKLAPPQCREFSGAYRQLLYSEAKTIGEIATSFNSVNIMNPDDMSKLLNSLRQMKNDPSIQVNIDKSADNADAALTTLVSNYDMEKPFDVPREQQTSGSIMGF